MEEIKLNPSLRQTMALLKSEVLLIAAFSFYLAAIPLRIYLANQYYFLLNATDVVFLSLILFLLTAAVLLTLLFYLPASLKRSVTKLTLALIIILFVYDNFLSPLIPELDGSVNAVSSSWFYALDLVIIGIIFFALKLDLKKIEPHLKQISYAIIGFSTLILATTLIQNYPLRQNEAISETIPMSPNLNVIQVLFDTLQSTQFEDAVKEQSLEDAYDGFIWFENMLGVRSSTSLTVPTIFTGKLFDARNQNQYYSGKTTTFLDILDQKDFDISLYTGIDTHAPKSAKVFKTR